MPTKQPMYRESKKKTESEQIRSEKKDVRNLPQYGERKMKRLYDADLRMNKLKKSATVRASDVRSAYESESKKRRMSGHVR